MPPAATVGNPMPKIALAVLLAALLTSCMTPTMAPSAAVNDLAPAGKVRAAINFGNPILATKDAATGEARGVSVDLARELARRLGVSVELVTFTTAGQVVDALKAGTVDVGFVAIDPERATDI